MVSFHEVETTVLPMEAFTSVSSVKIFNGEMNYILICCSMHEVNARTRWTHNDKDEFLFCLSSCISDTYLPDVDGISKWRDLGSSQR
jgi:hypothetical protein